MGEGERGVEMNEEEKHEIEKIIRKLEMYLETKDVGYLNKAVSLLNELVEELENDPQ